MTWLERLSFLRREGVDCVVVTVARVRGHAPRGAGAKMIVTRADVWGSVGGGNLEESAVRRSRAMLESHEGEPSLETVLLSPRGGEHGVQCCGGEVTLLLEPHAARRDTVAIFGAGHVGRALVRALAPLPVDMVVIDSRADRIAALPRADDAVARLDARHAAVPEVEVPSLPPRCIALVLTHDHAEDLAILERLLRGDARFLGLIGSSSKWRHFRRELLEHGLGEDELARVTTPIGLPDVPGKSPAAIAIAVAAQLLTLLELPEGDA